MDSSAELDQDPEQFRGRPPWLNRLLFALVFGGISAVILGGFWLIRDVTPTPGPEPLPPPLRSAPQDDAAAMRTELSRRHQEDVRILKTACVRSKGEGEGLKGRSFLREDEGATEPAVYFVRYEILGDERRKVEAVIILRDGLLDEVYPVTFLDYGRLRRGHEVTATPARKTGRPSPFGR